MTKPTGENKKVRKPNQQKARPKKIDPLEPLKLEIAEELGLTEKVKNTGWESLSAREAGRIGGIMTHRLKAMRQGTN